MTLKLIFIVIQVSSLTPLNCRIIVTRKVSPYIILRDKLELKRVVTKDEKQYVENVYKTVYMGFKNIKPMITFDVSVMVLEVKTRQTTVILHK